MRELVLTCALTLLGSGCVEVVSHRDDFDAGPDIVVRDTTGEAEASLGQCTSGVRWMGGNDSAVHNPGRPCMGSGCHSATSKTPMTIAGTVYPFMGDHDDDNCNGINASMMGAAIGILDDNGNDMGQRIQVNNAGNFYAKRDLPPSFKVRLYSQGRDIAQMSPITDGNCNSCHTKDGVAGAKGRIVPAPPN
jgi:hypothetical protein